MNIERVGVAMSFVIIGKVPKLLLVHSKAVFVTILLIIIMFLLSTEKSGEDGMAL